MKVSLDWLRDFVELPCDLKQLVHELTMLGLNVERAQPLLSIGTLSGMVVGQITSLQRHPEAPSLWVARVDIGDRALSLVSGATNLYEGAYVPVILPGNALPDGTVIEGRLFRGIPSEGMMISADELGLPSLDRAVASETAEDVAEAAGILILDATARPGTPLAEALKLEDPVLELDLTPNYAAHAQSVLGVAREIQALTGNACVMPGDVPARVPAGEDVNVSDYVTCDPRPSEKVATVEIANDQMCRRYSALVVDDINIKQSPLWMRQRLLQSGVRPINNVVDITNYVMLELGQPLHAFDYSLLENGKVIVRPAQQGEQLETLDGVKRSLTPEDLVIANKSRAVGLAGVMGGQNSEVTENTRTILLESANFDARTVLRTARRLGLWTEASRRFEKGMDYAMTVPALLRCAQLFVELDAGRPLSTVIDKIEREPEAQVVSLRVPRVNELLGVELSAGEISDLLTRLGFSVQNPAGQQAGACDEGTLAVTLPSHRPDVATEIDLVEEVARLYGYDRLPTTVPYGSPSRDVVPEEFVTRQHVRRLLVGAGLNEVLTFSITDPESSLRMGWEESDPRTHVVPLANPMTRERSVLRASLTPSIIDVLAYNARQRVDDVAVFELGRVYRTTGTLPLTDLPEEPLMVGIGLMGSQTPRTWNEPDRAADFYDLKGIVEALLDGLGIERYTMRAAEQPHLHPGRTAVVLVDELPVGWMGELHPRIIEEYGLPGRAYVAELQYDALFGAADLVNGYRPVPSVPPVVRDLAVIVDDEVPAALVETAIASAGGELVEAVELFDVYVGPPVHEGRKSLAYSVTYRADHTLTDDEVNDVHDRVRSELVSRFDAELRS